MDAPHTQAKMRLATKGAFLFIMIDTWREAVVGESLPPQGLYDPDQSGGNCQFESMPNLQG